MKKRHNIKTTEYQNGELSPTVALGLTDKIPVNGQTVAHRQTATLSKLSDKTALSIIFGLIIYILSITVFHVIIIGYCVIPLG